MSERFRTPDQMVLDFLRSEAETLLAQCNDEQRAFFARLFPGGISLMSEKKLRTAVSLCQRTIAKNDKGRALLV